METRSIRLLVGRSLLVFALGLVAAIGFGQTVPKMLIIQANVPENKEGDPNVPVAIQLSKELDDGGRVSTIVWSMTDPVFRQAVGDQKIFLLDKPRDGDAIAAARVLGAEYVVIFTAYRAKGGVASEIKLYRNGHAEWHDKENMHVGLGGRFDSDASALSVARTMAFKMVQSALKNLPAYPKAKIPETAPGQAPVVVAPTPVAPLSDDELEKTVATLMKSNAYANAIETLRDAVDAAPFDARRRKLLIQTLQTRDPDHAAEEAHRAAMMIRDDGEFRILAARAWMQAGRAKEAQDELNDAVAHDANAPATRLLLGEVALENLEPERALPHLEAAIKAQPSAEAYFLRAVCRALLGGIDGVKLDLDAMNKADAKPSATEVLERHRLAVAIFGPLIAKDAGHLRDLIQKASIKPKDAGVREDLQSYQRKFNARVSLLEMLQVPPGVEKTNDRWVLAAKLLAQTIMDIQSFVAGADDSLVDARMNLGEGLKQAQSAQADGN